MAASEDDGSGSGAAAAQQASGGSAPPAVSSIYNYFTNYARNQGADDNAAHEFASLGLGVTSREGLNAKNLWGNSGDQGRSWGPFQLLVGGGLGDEMGGDRSPANQMRVAAEHMWNGKGTDGYYNTAPWNGAGDYLKGFGTGSSALNDSEQAQSAMIGLGSSLATKHGLTPAGVDPRSFQADASGGGGAGGALSAFNMGGGNPGALYGGEAQAPMDIGERMTRFGAALAGISNPAQAQAMLANIPKASTPTSAIDMATKRLQLLALQKKINTPDSMTYQGLAKDGKTPMYTDPKSGLLVDGQGQQINQAPEAPVDPADGIEKFIPKIGSAVGSTTSNSNVINNINDVQRELVSNPDVFQNMRWDASLKSFVNNATGKADDMSLFQKKAQAAVSQALLATAKDVTGGRTTNYLAQKELDSIAPNGAMLDANTLNNVFNTIRQSAQSRYNNGLGEVQAYHKKFGDAYPFQLPDDTGKNLNPVEWATYNKNKWDAANTDITDKYNNVMKPWHDRNSGVTPPKPSFLDFAKPNQ